ncbi:MAG: hypothetical protein QOF37_1548, partial [Thermoleophilaceae bacterium]|nr:hypothetical protein [Thermoleophilaceae bacterium]
VVLVIFAILGVTGGGNGNKATPTTPATAKKKRPSAPKRRRTPSAPAATTVSLRVSPAEPTYVCVDKGPGTTPTQGTLSSPATYRGRHLRLNAGRSSLRLSVNGKRVRVPTSNTAIGYDFRLRRGRVSTTPLPLGQRPC